MILVVCERCAHWAVPVFAKMTAHLTGALHEYQVHPTSQRARGAAWLYAKRHTEELDAFRGMSIYAAIIQSWDFSEEANLRGRPRRTSSPSEAETV